eukprot:s3699_g1.t1
MPKSKCNGWTLFLACALLVRAWSQHQEALFPLDGRNFSWAMRAYPRMMLFFYAPWCGHSRGLEPEVKKAAELLQGNVAFAKIVPCRPETNNKATQQQEEFGGRRASAAIVDWVRSKVGPALEVVTSTDQMQAPASQAAQMSTTREQVGQWRLAIGGWLQLKIKGATLDQETQQAQTQPYAQKLIASVCSKLQEKVLRIRRERAAIRAAIQAEEAEEAIVPAKQTIKTFRCFLLPHLASLSSSAQAERQAAL